MTRHIVYLCLYCILIAILVYFTYGPILTFSFWKDDWILLWNGLYHPELLFRNWLHPATNTEFILLSRWFGENPLLWHLFGMMLRSAAAVSVALMIGKITKSAGSGIAGGVLFATSAIGLDAVGWPSAHVVLVALMFLCLGFSFFIDCIRKPSGGTLVLFIFWTSVGILADPWRALPVIFLFWVFIVLFGSARLNSFMRTMQIPSLVVLAIVVLLLFIWHREVILGTRLAIFLSREWQHPFVVFGKSVFANTYINSLFNLVTGWILMLPEDGSTGVYNRVHALIGGIVLIGVIVSCLVGIKKRSKHAGIVLFFVLWILLFYLPNWLFEPAITAGVTHRYLVISSVGFLGLIAYGVTHVRPVFLAALLTGCFIVANVVVVQQRLAFALRYRSADVVDQIWDTIDQNVVSTTADNIFMYLGEDPVKTYVLNLSGSVPFALRRHITNFSDFPIVTHDTAHILQYVCQTDRYVLNHVYAFRADNDGFVIDVSKRERNRLAKEAAAIGCVPRVVQ